MDLMFLMCAFVIASGEPHCGEPLPWRDAVAMTVATNNEHRFKVGDKLTPYTLFEVRADPRNGR